jgi:Glycosyl hydrolases family 16
MPAVRVVLDEAFSGHDLDPDVWLPSYLPHWSSRADAAAAYEVHDGELRLTIPPDHPLWCAGNHEEPLRVSCVQTGNWSGPVGSTVGPQPFRGGLTVREAQAQWWGYTPTYGEIEVRMRGVVSPRSMVAFWMSGIEDVPERSGEICVAEIFGDAVRDGSADVGVGVKRLRDPGLRQDFSTVRLPLDVAAFNTYAVEWRPGSLVFAVNGSVVRRVDQAPDYPVQLMIGVFDFPTKSIGGDDALVPELVVSHVRGRPLA